MLGDGGRVRSDVVCKVVDGVLTVQKRPKDSEPSLDRYGLQEIDRRSERAVGWLSIYLSCHADSVPIRMMKRAVAYPPLPVGRVDLAANVASSAAFATVSDAIGGNGHTALTLISHNT